MSAPRVKTFGFLLTPNFTTIGFACAIETLRMANMAAKRTLYRTLLIAADHEPVRASNGMCVVPDHSIADVPELDVLFVVGSNPIPVKNDRILLNWHRKLSQHHVPLGGICTGSHLLADRKSTRLNSSH